MRHPVKDKSRFVLPEQVYNNPFIIQIGVVCFLL